MLERSPASFDPPNAKIRPSTTAAPNDLLSVSIDAFVDHGALPKTCSFNDLHSFRSLNIIAHGTAISADVVSVFESLMCGLTEGEEGESASRGCTKTDDEGEDDEEDEDEMGGLGNGRGGCWRYERSREAVIEEVREEVRSSDDSLMRLSMYRLRRAC